VDSLKFLNPEQVRRIAQKFGTPVFVYDEATLVQLAKEVLNFPNRYGLTVRYAMKALPNAAILKLFDSLGLHIDASSGMEVERALLAGILPEKLQLATQEMPENLEMLLDKGVIFCACSLNQLEIYGKIRPGSSVCVRVNPGLGSGHSNRTNVGGPSSSFGIWWEYIGEINELAERYGLSITKIHTHIGSGADPRVWEKVARMSLGICEEFDGVTCLNLGGGFKIARMAYETSIDFQSISEALVSAFGKFEQKTGRKLRLEIEPGTYLVGSAGAIISTIIDKVDTGKNGYQFIKIDSGMTEIMRPSLYGAQHPLISIPREENAASPDSKMTVLVSGHCCESGDILTPENGNPEGLNPREIRNASVSDYLVIAGAGAYCSAMAAKNYNSFCEVPEILLDRNGSFRLIRKCQTLKQMVENECDLVL